MTKVHTSMSCFSCAHWDGSYTHCEFGLRGHRYTDKEFCRRWMEHPKFTIMKEKTQAQVNMSRWNGPTIAHRRLEVM